MTAVSPTSTTTAARLCRLTWRVVGAVNGRWRLIRLGRRCGFVPRSGELLQAAGRVEELLAINVRVPRNGREVGVAEVLSDETRVAEFLAKPCCGRVAQRVRRNVLRDVGTCRGATDDVGEGRLLQTTAGEPAEHGVGRIRLATVAQFPKLPGKSGRHRLAARLAAFAAADEQRPPASI